MGCECLMESKEFRISFRDSMLAQRKPDSNARLLVKGVLYTRAGGQGRGCAQNIVDCIGLLRRVHNGGRGDAQLERHFSTPCNKLLYCLLWR